VEYGACGGGRGRAGERVLAFGYEEVKVVIIEWVSAGA
jgi:hypothetical protein